MIYVGCGVPSLFLRPSPWGNFFLDHHSRADANALYREFAFSRADRREWLHPLFGKVLLCDCSGEFCHAGVLCDLVLTCGQPIAGQSGQDWGDASSAGSIPAAAAVTAAGTVAATSRNTSAPMNDMPIEDDSDKPTNNQLCAVPGWPEAWRELVNLVRGFSRRCFWDLSAGSTSLSLAFARDGWEVAPPVGIDGHDSFDFDNPELVVIILALLHEGRVAAVHLRVRSSSSQSTGPVDIAKTTC